MAEHSEDFGMVVDHARVTPLGTDEDGKMLSAKARAAAPRMQRWVDQASRRFHPLCRCGTCGGFAISPCQCQVCVSALSGSKEGDRG